MSNLRRHMERRRAAERRAADKATREVRGIYRDEYATNFFLGGTPLAGPPFQAGVPNHIHVRSQHDRWLGICGSDVYGNLPTSNLEGLERCPYCVELGWLDAPLTL